MCVRVRVCTCVCFLCDERDYGIKEARPRQFSSVWTKAALSSSSTMTNTDECLAAHWRCSQSLPPRPPYVLSSRASDWCPVPGCAQSSHVSSSDSTDQTLRTSQISHSSFLPSFHSLSTPLSFSPFLSLSLSLSHTHTLPLSLSFCLCACSYCLFAFPSFREAKNRSDFSPIQSLAVGQAAETRGPQGASVSGFTFYGANPKRVWVVSQNNNVCLSV